jgi:sirohydrochlorin ferrochelatase
MRPGLAVATGYLELSRPLLEDVVGAGSVVVPLLLGAGYHTRVDIAGRVPPGTRVAAPLGPDPLLVTALTDRLAAAGWRPGEPVVLAAAGSTEPESAAAARATGELLAAATGSPVRTAFVGTTHPRVPHALAGLRAAHPGRRVAIAAYLLAPGRFAATLDRFEPDPGVAVAAPLGDHPALAALVLARYDQARTGPPVAAALNGGS